MYFRASRQSVDCITSALTRIWVSDLTITKSGFIGNIANEATTVRSVSLGQKVNVVFDNITDWSYNNGGIKQGAFTLRVLLKRLPKEQAEFYRKAVGWD